MKPRKTPQKDRQRDLFRATLVNIIDPNHGLVKLSKFFEMKELKEKKEKISWVSKKIYVTEEKYEKAIKILDENLKINISSFKIT